MKNILLTTSALVAFAGAAAADGHTSFTWGGSATAGVAREGSAAAAKATAAASTAAERILYLTGTGEATNWQSTDAAGKASGVITATELAAERADALADRDSALTAAASMNAVDEAAAIIAANKAYAVRSAALDYMGGTLATTKAAAGDTDTYAEVNITATGSVTLDSGVSMSAAVSVDAGTGYNFADDDGFDAAKTNGVSLDSVTIDGGAMGALTIDKNDVAHLVDGDDDATGDIKYTYSIGAYDFALVYDMQKDTDDKAARAGVGSVTAGTGAWVAGSAAVAADVAWSTKLNYTVSDSLGVYVAADEEGGNTVGGSYSMAGFTVSASSALEALQEELKEDRSNTLTVGYTAGAYTVGASYNSIKDGNQWSANAAYAANGLSVTASTNEADSWAITAGYELADSASLVGGVNYSDDAYVGVKFDF